MAQQMVNVSHHEGSVTITNRMSMRYGVIGAPYSGAHLKPQDAKSIAKREAHWKQMEERAKREKMNGAEN